MDVDHPALPELCRRYHVRQLDVFGSASNGQFNPARSDLDFLVTFEDMPEGTSISRTYFGLLRELGDLYHREIDLLTERSIRNPFLRRSIEVQRRRVYPQP